MDFGEHISYKCPKCKGNGTHWTSTFSDIATKMESGHFHKCKKCNGKGELNWIENIFGVRVMSRRESMDTMVAIHEIENDSKSKIQLNVVKNRFKK